MTKKSSVLICGARLCLKDQPQRFANRKVLQKPNVSHSGTLRLVLRTRPRSFLPGT
jgi:hypothetical protein